MTPPKGKAVSLFTIRPQSRTTRVIAAFLKSTGAKVHQDHTSITDGMPTRQLLSVISDGNQRAVVVSHFYQKGTDVFAFHGMVDEASYSAMSKLIQRPATGFAVMTNRGRLNRQPRRIVVKSVARSVSMEKTLRTMKIDRDLWAKVAWLNGRQLTDVLNGGEQIKVIK